METKRMWRLWCGVKDDPNSWKPKDILVKNPTGDFMRKDAFPTQRYAWIEEYHEVKEGDNG